jgi:hypothetical protein
VSASLRPVSLTRGRVLLVLLLGLAAASTPVGALDTLARSSLPSLVGQGASGYSTASGFASLFANPAGFRAAPGESVRPGGEPGEVTLLSLNPWYEADIPWDGDVEGAMLAEAASGRLRYGSTMGIGYVGRGLGLGAVLAGGADIAGSTSLAGRAEMELALVGGYSYAVDLMGLRLRLGAAVRPLLHVEVPLDDTSARRLIHESAQGGLGVVQALWFDDALYGLGLAVDMGAILDLGRLHLGILFSDVGDTTVHYSQSRLSNLVTAVASLNPLPQGTSTNDSLTVPMLVRVGAEFVPFDGLALHAEIADPPGLLAGDRELVDAIHVGAEVALSAKARLWLGYEARGASAGASLRFGPIEAGVSFYGADLGSESLSFVGIAAETAIRF